MNPALNGHRPNTRNCSSWSVNSAWRAACRLFAEWTSCPTFLHYLHSGPLVRSALGQHDDMSFGLFACHACRLTCYHTVTAGQTMYCKKDIMILYYKYDNVQRLSNEFVFLSTKWDTTSH